MVGMYLPVYLPPYTTLGTPVLPRAGYRTGSGVRAQRCTGARASSCITDSYRRGSYRRVSIARFTVGRCCSRPADLLPVYPRNEGMLRRVCTSRPLPVSLLD